MRKLHGFADVEHEVVTGPDGVEMYLPWNLKFLICSKCHRPTVSADIHESLSDSLRRYTEPGYVRWTGGKIGGRPVCVGCKEGRRRG